MSDLTKYSPLAMHREELIELVFILKSRLALAERVVEEARKYLQFPCGMAAQLLAEYITAYEEVQDADKD